MGQWVYRVPTHAMGHFAMCDGFDGRGIDVHLADAGRFAGDHEPLDCSADVVRATGTAWNSGR